jgi:hypothetical protein
MTEKMIEAKKNERPNALKEMHLCKDFGFTPWIL